MGWETRANAGDKIVCINDQWIGSKSGWDAVGPQLREVVQITEVIFNPSYGVCFRLFEYPGDRAYLASQFRPVEPASDKADRGLQAILDQFNTEPATEDA